MLGKNHQSFEVVIFEAPSGYAMTKEEPSDNSAARIEGHDHFRAESVERTAKKRSLGAVERLREIRAGNQMRVQLKPAHQRIAFTKFNLVRLRQTAQPGPKL